jgi:hypothetical protein
MRATIRRMRPEAKRPTGARSRDAASSAQRQPVATRFRNRSAERGIQAMLRAVSRRELWQRLPTARVDTYVVLTAAEVA